MSNFKNGEYLGLHPKVGERDWKMIPMNPLDKDFLDSLDFDDYLEERKKRNESNLRIMSTGNLRGVSPQGWKAGGITGDRASVTPIDARRNRNKS